MSVNKVSFSIVKKSLPQISLISADFICANQRNLREKLLKRRALISFQKAPVLRNTLNDSTSI